MKIDIHEEARPLASSSGFRCFLSLDLAAHAVLLVSAIRWWILGIHADPSWFSPACAAYALLAIVTSLGALGLRARAIVWRRRVAFGGLICALLRGTPIASVWLKAGVVLWCAGVWIATLLESRRVSQAVVETEEGAKAAAAFK